MEEMMLDPTIDQPECFVIDAIKLQWTSTMGPNDYVSRKKESI